MCEFCEKFNFESAAAVVDSSGARIHTALGNTKFREDMQFKFCPRCAEPVESVKLKRAKKAY